MTEDVQNELWTTFPDEMKACMKSDSVRFNELIMNCRLGW